MPKPIPKPIVALASPVAGPSTAPIVPSSASKPAAAAALSKPAPVKSTGPAVKGGSVVKDSFMMKNLATKTMTKMVMDDEDGKGDDDNSNTDDATIDIDSAKRPEETWPTAPTKAMVTKVETPAPVPVADKTEEDALLQIVLY
ncbi:hypothetical protein C0995_014550 [Termitomyces sp. Mi166|nr:hypothetical protein C0995_014550 [Termitomyces sp. Mi166\